MINPWRYKPWWCQPWSILLTGCGLIALSITYLPAYWWILPALPIAAWMTYFLLVWPPLMRRYLATQENNASDR